MSESHRSLSRGIFLVEEQGQALSEYGVVIVLVAIIMVVLLTVLGPQVANMYSRITNGLAAGS
ncbi:MAG: hypothetical protein HYX86_06795 [Chloroflexi bacterium]|nr:hypothetical protein [Chloroflexota bacterium]